ncbi:hypothetical protein F5X99DRAFT_271420 [Biscogniauxia marginata]|nr:hypothetical protein F5X99DRAFT_271420 [Biscogniauxia marginata]
MGRQLVKDDDAELGTCPVGSVYYKCRLNNFSGCCQSDPCANPGPDPCKDDDKPSTAPTSTNKVTSTDSPGTTPASSTTDTTLITSVLSTTDATGGPTAITESATLPTPTDSSQSNGDSASASLSQSQVVGASIGGTIGAIALLLIAFLLIRRHRISKRMSSTRGGSPTYFDEKSAIDQSQSSPKGASGENDVFAPFGGRANSHEIDRRQPDSQPVCIELDANEAENPNSSKQRPPSELPVTPKQGSSSRGSSQFHPSPLTPGTPGTQMSIQNQLMTRKDDQGESSGSQLDAHRATLNATDTERAKGYHALSWNSP